LTAFGLTHRAFLRFARKLGDLLLRRVARFAQRRASLSFFAFQRLFQAVRVAMHLRLHLVRILVRILLRIGLLVWIAGGHRHISLLLCHSEKGQDGQDDNDQANKIDYRVHAGCPPAVVNPNSPQAFPFRMRPYFGLIPPLCAKA
jgi:hypothetical protein